MASQPRSPDFILPLSNFLMPSLTYLAGCPASFVSTADVSFVVQGTRLPVHSQFLSRWCSFFSDMFSTLESLPSPQKPCRIEQALAGTELPHIKLFLTCLYRSGELSKLVASADFSTPAALAGARAPLAQTWACCGLSHCCMARWSLAS